MRDLDRGFAMSCSGRLCVVNGSLRQVGQWIRYMGERLKTKIVLPRLLQMMRSLDMASYRLAYEDHRVGGG